MSTKQHLARSLACLALLAAPISHADTEITSGDITIRAKWEAPLTCTLDTTAVQFDDITRTTWNVLEKAQDIQVTCSNIQAGTVISLYNEFPTSSTFGGTYSFEKEFLYRVADGGKSHPISVGAKGQFNHMDAVTVSQYETSKTITLKGHFYIKTQNSDDIIKDLVSSNLDSITLEFNVPLLIKASLP